MKKLGDEFGMKVRNKMMIFISCCLLLAGCTSPSAQGNKDANKVLKVMYWDESYFFQQYGDLFTMKYPNTEIQVVAMEKLYNQKDENGNPVNYDKAFSNLVEKEKPDVLLLASNLFPQYATEGKLTELGALIERDHYDLTTYSKGILESIKEKGEGKLYGLSPGFQSNAIFYNVDLFKKHGIDLPHDGMTWQEILELARRFPTEGNKDERIYGFALARSSNLNAVGNLGITMGTSQGINLLNGKTKKVTLDTESWKNIFKLATEVASSKAIYDPNLEEHAQTGNNDYFASQPFLMGRVAIAVESNQFLQELKEVSNNPKKYKNYKPFELGIAAGPVDPVDPTKTNGAYLNEIFTISAESPNTEVAWDFIKFVNGEDFAKVKAKSLNQGLLAREGISKDYDGISLEAFYKLTPKMAPDFGENLIPTSFYQPFLTVLERETELLQDNKKSVEEVLKLVQTEAQAALDQAFKDEEAKKESTNKK
ncbi:ABC transporter substrate-binding protein [Paenibacillus turicensis]|uniref:ABC transporter substrate-binding protein n=1 Tax=Paenibacillus turicensis TaxID=160487 RepID=UPI003D27018E